MNPLQFRLLEAWRGTGYDVTAVGDPQQAIYGWNGADAALPARHPPPLAAGRGDRARAQLPVDPADPRRRRRRCCGRRSSRPQDVDAHAARSARRPTVTAPPHRPGRGHRRRPRRPPGPRPRAAVGGPGRARAHPRADRAASPRRCGSRASPTACGAAPASSSGPRCAGRCASSAPRDVPLGTALADLELGPRRRRPVARTLDAARPRRPRGPRRGRCAAHDDERAAIALVLQMGRDYLRLDPVGGGRHLRRLAGRHRPVRGATRAPGGDAVDVATFHAAKGLEWAIVHLAGVEDGYVPIAHARTAAARGRGGPAALRRDDAGPARAAHHLGRAAHVRRRASSTGAARRCSPRSPTARRVDVRARPARPPRRSRTGPTSWPASGRQLDRSRRPRQPELEALRQLARHRGPGRTGRARGGAARPRARARSSTPSPRDLAALGAIRGVGTILAGRFGPDLLVALDGSRARRRSDDEVHRRPALRRRSPTRSPAPSPTPSSTPRCPAGAKLAAPEVVAHERRRRHGACCRSATASAATCPRRPGRCSTRPGSPGWSSTTHDLGRPHHARSCCTPTTTPTACGAEGTVRVEPRRRRRPATAARRPEGPGSARRRARWSGRSWPTSRTTSATRSPMVEAFLARQPAEPGRVAPTGARPAAAFSSANLSMSHRDEEPLGLGAQHVAGVELAAREDLAARRRASSRPTKRSSVCSGVGER